MATKEIEINTVECPASSNISRIGYHQDAKNPILFVIFLTTPNVLYMYKGVPKVTYDDFVKASSKGGYFNKFIKGRFQMERCPIKIEEQ